MSLEGNEDRITRLEKRTDEIIRLISTLTVSDNKNAQAAATLPKILVFQWENTLKLFVMLAVHLNAPEDFIRQIRGLESRASLTADQADAGLDTILANLQNPAPPDDDPTAA